MNFFKKTKDGFKKHEWKIYFLIFVYGNISYILMRTTFNLTDLIIPALITFGFFGLAWKKKILSQLFWKIIFMLIVPLKIYLVVFFITVHNLWSQLLIPQNMLFFMATHFITVFGFIGLYFYAFKSENIWGATKSTL